MDASTFRDALGRFATGVTVVGIDTPDGPRGITVNAFLSLSLEPPLVGVAIGTKAGAHESLELATHYGVSVLASEQRDLSDRFAGRPIEPDFTWLVDSGAPVLDGALVQLTCRIVDRHPVGDHTLFVGQHPVGDHTLFVGQVEHAVTQDGAPLLYQRGRYGVDGAN